MYAIFSLDRSVAVYRDRLNEIERAIGGLGVLRRKLAHPKDNWLGLPIKIEDGSGPINLVGPFCPPLLLAAYEFGVLIDLDKVYQFLQLKDEERDKVKKWRTIPYQMSWQRWTGGYERLRVSVKDLGTGVVYDREHNSYHSDPNFLGSSSVRGCVWAEGIGDAEVQLEVLPGKSIRLFARRGRFGDKRRDFPFDREVEPLPQALLFEVPLQEHLLDQFEKRREEFDPSWAPQFGRPAKRYDFKDEQRGIWWSLDYYFDRRPLVSGEVEEIQVPGEPNGTEVGISYRCGRFSAEGGSRWVPYNFEHDGWASVGNQVYVNFDEDGSVDYIWPKVEIQRQIKGEPRKDSL